jgi:hypothetical protein
MDASSQLRFKIDDAVPHVIENIPALVKNCGTMSFNAYLFADCDSWPSLAELL